MSETRPFATAVNTSWLDDHGSRRKDTMQPEATECNTYMSVYPSKVTLNGKKIYISDRGLDIKYVDKGITAVTMTIYLGSLDIRNKDL